MLRRMWVSLKGDCEEGVGFRQATAVRMGVLNQRNGVRSVLDHSFEFVKS